ncbi:hypothetical protein CH373_15040 [Leptospira perolatii]|uniref:Uncharacterized protein n=1 Tax=Leptospira perolatii TaxID=2023191 RepID=A0A2M9ZJL1_9LEPT|nr:hypothetical protein [Leptospira perolatii]PJZ68584.1 hypothetical protein CH360_15495 [Leptospira perolatii]PJZ72239.1 hypothetical protein CH373_15040 [Leptospira perolatii]
MTFPFALIYSPKVDLFLYLLFAIAGIGFLFFLYWEIVRPYLLKTKPGQMDPPDEGQVFSLVIPESTRSYKFSIGQISGDVRTVCKAIQDNHLVFHIKKAKETEDYDIEIEKQGPTLIKPPRMQFFTKMESVEKLESHEIIGYTANFRISDKVIKERMTQYFEISLGSEFFMNRMGKERMRFLFTIEKIHPGLSYGSRDKKGLYSFGKETGRSED